MLVEEKRLLAAAGEDVRAVKFVSDYHSDGVGDEWYEQGGPDVHGSASAHKL